MERGEGKDVKPQAGTPPEPFGKLRVNFLAKDLAGMESNFALKLKETNGGNLKQLSLDKNANESV